MKIIGGQFGGRNFTVAKNVDFRPTTDFAKQALFNILTSSIEIEQQVVLDLFAGSGAISYEFVSRGAEHVDCVEIHRKNIDCITSNIQKLGIDNMNVFQYDAFKYLRRSNFGRNYTIVFADPPYTLTSVADLPKLIMEHNNLLTDTGMFILEHTAKYDFSDLSYFQQRREYGAVVYSFFKK